MRERIMRSDRIIRRRRRRRRNKRRRCGGKGRKWRRRMRKRIRRRVTSKLRNEFQEVFLLPITMQWMIKINVNVRKYVKLQLSPCLIEENTMKVNGQVDEQHFVLSALSRVIGEIYAASPLNARKMDAVSH